MKYLQISMNQNDEKKRHDDVVVLIVFSVPNAGTSHHHSTRHYSFLECCDVYSEHKNIPGQSYTYDYHSLYAYIPLYGSEKVVVLEKWVWNSPHSFPRSTESCQNRAPFPSRFCRPVKHEISTHCELNVVSCT